MNEKLKVYDTKMQKTMDSLDSEMGTIRAGRANPNVLNRIMVDYYGTPTPKLARKQSWFLIWVSIRQMTELL